MIYRCILSSWVSEEFTNLKKVIEGEFTDEQIKDLNSKGYNIYYLPNSPSIYEGGNVSGFQIDKFDWVFVDCDLKDGTYKTEDDFLKTVGEKLPIPTKVVLSGHGVHVYWKVSDLDAKSYLKLQRRLIRKLNTDEAVGQIYQLMRVPNTINTKVKEEPKLCELVYSGNAVYTCEDLDKVLDPLTNEDAIYCTQHYEKTYNLQLKDIEIEDKIPLKFIQLIDSNEEVKDIWKGNLDDRSKGDFRLGHIMFASGFNKEEATSVLVNSAKALARAPIHRLNYATNIVDKIWTYELSSDKKGLTLSSSVRDILNRAGDALKGTRFACHPFLDNTVHGFRLGQVIGLVAGSGVGKTSMAINMFRWFTERNPEYDHFFVSLEQPANEIADRWKTVCQGDERLHDKVHVVSNYNDDGTFRHLSLSDIKDYIISYQRTTGRKVGTCVIDHIGALNKKTKDGENQGIIDICHQMKGFALETNTMVIMQSQAPREKAGIGDLELNKDAAYGTVFFESYVDYLLCIWQPLKRVYSEGAPTVMALKFAKIRHKKQGQDKIQEDICYRLFFDPKIEQLRELTEEEDKSFDFFQNKQLI